MTMEVDGGRQDPGRIVELVHSHIPGASFVRAAAAELTMRLPMTHTGQFADMLDSLEANKAGLGLSYYSISMPSLVSWRELQGSLALFGAPRLGCECARKSLIPDFHRA